MSTPFPGMDPYLEGELWTSFHSMLASEVVAALNPLLVPRYLAFSEKYQLSGRPEDISIENRVLVPDVGITHMGTVPAASESTSTLAAPLVVHAPMRIPIPHARVLIRDVKSRHLVTVIEFLSPTNKRNPGRRKYLRRRERILASSTHLLEIDWIRSGRRLPSVEPLPNSPYFVFLSRGGRRPVSEVLPIRLEDPLPCVPVPLLPGDEDVPLELQKVFHSTFDRAYFDVAIDYRLPPSPPLSPELDAWTDEILRAAGKRS